MTELKSEKNFELAVKIFEISDELCFKENRKYHEITRQQARRTTAECLNVIFNKIPENSPASVGSGMNPVFLYVKSFFLRNLSYLS